MTAEHASEELRMTVLATATVTTSNPSADAGNRPSLYADPVAWLADAAVGRAMEERGADLAVGREDVGTIAMSATATQSTMEGIGRGVPRSRVSPLRFAGANPGLLAGLPCIFRGFQGPSLMLAMHPADAVDTAMCLAASWLRTGQSRHVVLLSHFARAGDHVARCAILAVAASDTSATEHARLRELLVDPVPSTGGQP